MFLPRYIVAVSRWSSVGTTVLRFRMQSRKDPVFLEERIEAFLGSFLEDLKECRMMTLMLVGEA